MDNEVDTALSKYRQSIEAAKKEAFLHEQALACERAGLALRKIGRENEALKFLVDAQSLYKSWGAKIKVEQMQRNHLLSVGGAGTYL